MPVPNTGLSSKNTGPAAKAGIVEVCSNLSEVLQNGVDVHRCFAAKALGEIAEPQSVDSLVQALLDEDEDVRTDVANALARIGDPGSAGQLIENLLGDPCCAVKLAAIDALVGMKHEAVIPWLRRLVHCRDEEISWDETSYYMDGWDDWADIQVKCVEALGVLHVVEAVADITSVIDDEEGQDLTEVGFKALANLGAFGAAALKKYFDTGDNRQRRRAIVHLAAMEGDGADATLSRALADPSSDVRLAAVKSLAGKNPADNRLAALFQDCSPEVGAAVVSLCGRYHLTEITAIVMDETALNRTAVFELLAREPGLVLDEDCVESLRSAAKCADREQAGAAIRAYAQIAPEQAINEIVELLGDAAHVVEVRFASLKALAKLPVTEKNIRVLANVLSDDNRQLRLEAMTVLANKAASENWPNLAGKFLLEALNGAFVPEPEDGRVAGPEIASNTELDEELEQAVDEAGQSSAASSESPASPSILLEPDDSAENGDASQTNGDAAEFPTSTLEAILGANSPGLEAANSAEDDVTLTEEDLEFLSLSKRGPKKRRVSVLPDVPLHQDIPRFAARVLGDIAHEDVAHALSKKLFSDDADLTRAAADSLVQIGEKLGGLPNQVVQNLLAASSAVDLECRRSIVRALGLSGSGDVVMKLVSCLHDESGFIRAEAIRALTQLGEAGQGMTAMLQDSDSNVRLAAAQAIADLDEDAALEKLVDFAFAFNGHHRRAVGKMLRKMDVETANARFIQVLGHPDRKNEWQVVIESLEELNRARM